MSEKQKRISEKVKRAVKSFDQGDTDYLCGFIDGMAVKASREEMEDSDEKK